MTSGSLEFLLRKDNDRILLRWLRRLDNQAELDKWSMGTLNRLLDTTAELRNALDFSLTELKGPGAQKRSSTAANLAPGSPEPPMKLLKPKEENPTTSHGAPGGTTTAAKKKLSLTISTAGSPSMICSESLIGTTSRSQSKEDSLSSWDEEFLSQVIGESNNGGKENGTEIDKSQPLRDDWTPMNGGIWSEKTLLE